jgi:hypothetical protein
MGQAASAANGDRRVVESFEFEHRPDALFDSLVVLFNEIFKYWLDRTLTLAGSSPASFISRTTRIL